MDADGTRPQTRGITVYACVGRDEGHSPHSTAVTACGTHSRYCGSCRSTARQRLAFSRLQADTPTHARLRRATRRAPRPIAPHKTQGLKPHLFATDCAFSSLTGNERANMVDGRRRRKSLSPFYELR